MPKINLVSDSRSYLGVKVPASAAINKGEVVVQNGVFTFTFDTYGAADERILIYAGAKIRVDAQAATTEIGAENFAILDKVYWDAGAAKITKVVGANTYVGRALENKNFVGGVVLGNSLLIDQFVL